MRKLKLKKTGRYAHVEMGEWDGSSYALDCDYPVVELPDGQLAVLMDMGRDELPPRCESQEMSASKQNGKA